MAEPNQSQPIEPSEPERYQTETDDVSQSSTSSGGDVQAGDDILAGPQVQVEPPLTMTQPHIFYIPVPSPGDPVPLIPTKPFVRPKSVFLSDFAVQSTITDEPTEPNQGREQPSGSGQIQTDSDVDISTLPVRPTTADVDIPVLRQPPAVGKQVPTPVRPPRIAKSSFDVDSNTPVPALGRVLWSSTDVPKSVFMPCVPSVNVFPPVAFGEFINAVPGTAPKSQTGWFSNPTPMPIPPPITGWRAPGIPHPPPLPAVPAGIHQRMVGLPSESTFTPGHAFVGQPIANPSMVRAVDAGVNIVTPTRMMDQASSEGTPYQTPSSIQFTTPRVIPGPRVVNIQPNVQPRVLFQTSTTEPNQTLNQTDERQGVRPFLSTSASSSQDVSGSVVQTELSTILSSIQTIPTAVHIASEPTQEPNNPEPEDEPQVPQIRVPAAWDKSEGIIILIGGFSNAGKSSLVESVATAFKLKRWQNHPNKKVWISNETGEEKNSRRQLLHYTNDSFRMSNDEINHNGLNQSLDTMCAKFKHWVVFVEGHRILDNEDLVNRASLFFWIHTPSKTRKLRSPYSKGKSTEAWNAQLREEQEYFSHHKHLFSTLPFTILDGLQTKAYNAMVVLAVMGNYNKDLDPKTQLCYHECELPEPEDETVHPKNDAKQFSTIFMSKIIRPTA